MPPSVASTRASSRRDKHRPGIVKCQVTDPSKIVADARDVHVVFRIKTRASAREFILQCRSELRDGHATFDVGRRYQDFVMYVLVRRLRTRTLDMVHFARAWTAFFNRFSASLNWII